MESPPVKGIVVSHIVGYISNPNTNEKKVIMKAKDNGNLSLEITFYRHTTDNILTKDFINIHMTNIKQLLPRELKYQNSINKQFDLVCNNIAHNVCIFISTSETTFLSLFYRSFTGKANCFFISNGNTTNRSNALICLSI